MNNHEPRPPSSLALDSKEILTLDGKHVATISKTLRVQPALLVAAIAMLFVSLCCVGCQQQRYQPAKWRPQTTNGIQLPGTTLPGTTLPGTTLPNNMPGTTLPLRPGTTLPR